MVHESELHHFWVMNKDGRHRRITSRPPPPDVFSCCPSLPRALPYRPWPPLSTSCKAWILFYATSACLVRFRLWEDPPPGRCHPSGRGSSDRVRGRARRRLPRRLCCWDPWSTRRRLPRACPEPRPWDAAAKSSAGALPLRTVLGRRADPGTDNQWCIREAVESS